MEKIPFEDQLGRRDSNRRLILVDIPPPQQGIAAALRRAFAAVHGDPEECEFELLLAKLH